MAVRKRKIGVEYPVVFEEDVFGDGQHALADVLKQVSGQEHPRLMLVADMNVAQRVQGLGSRIGRWVKANAFELAAPPVLISGGEKVKVDGVSGVTQVIDSVLEAKIGCQDLLLALGGGTILDIAGYVGAQLRGGVKVVRLPTTPAAMIDAAFADSAAINSCRVKDALRVASHPAAVVIDTTFLRTVADGVWCGGISEAIRLALVSDAALFKRIVSMAEGLKARDLALMSALVADCVAVRQKKGDSSFALWSAGRLESMSGWRLPHGYAVAIGLLVDATYAKLKGLLAEADLLALTELLRTCGAMEGVQHNRHLIAQTANVMRGLDALKLSQGSDALILPVGLGKHVLAESVDRETMKQALDLIK